MTRRQIHGLLVVIGILIVAAAWFNVLSSRYVPWDWIDRSDTLFAGLLVLALGLHGLWKNDPR